MRVELQKSPRQALVVPEEAVVPVGNENFVWIVADKDGQAVAERRTVTLGTRQFGGVEVLSGLSPGERVVTRHLAHAPRRAAHDHRGGAR